MPRFRYTAVDGEGRPVSGELTASHLDEAQAELAARGLKNGQCTACDAASHVQPLSVEEAAELGGQVADLTKAGLPLGAGLRAMAEELSRIRIAWVMRSIADQVDAGVSLEAAIESHADLLPGHVRGLIVAGHRSGHLADVLEQLVELERSRIELRRRLWTALAYPTLLMLILLSILFLFSMFVVVECRQMFNVFGLELPHFTRLVLSVFSPGVNAQIAVAAFLALGLFHLCTTGRPVWAQPVLYAIPVAGPIWRWSRLAEFARLMGLLLDQRLPLPNALRLTAEGMEEPELAVACFGMADQVEAGRPLAECLGDFRRFPSTLRALVQWGQHTPRLGEAFRSAAEMFDGRVRVYAAVLETFMPPLVFVFILGVVGFLMVGLIVPMVSVIGWI